MDYLENQDKQVEAFLAKLCRKSKLLALGHWQSMSEEVMEAKGKTVELEEKEEKAKMHVKCNRFLKEIQIF